MGKSKSMPEIGKLEERVFLLYNYDSDIRTTLKNV